jgi:hypothetical protein
MAPKIKDKMSNPKKVKKALSPKILGNFFKKISIFFN